MNCLIIVGPSITGRREVEIRIRTYSDSITSVHRGAGRIEDYNHDYKRCRMFRLLQISIKEAIRISKQSFLHNFCTVSISKHKK